MGQRALKLGMLLGSGARSTVHYAAMGPAAVVVGGVVAGHAMKDVAKGVGLGWDVKDAQYKAQSTRHEEPSTVQGELAAG